MTDQPDQNQTDEDTLGAVHPDALAPEEIEAFEAMCATLDSVINDPMESARVALMRCKVDPEQLPENVAVAIAMYSTDDGERTYPMAILVTPDIFDALTPPDGGEEIEEDGDE